jgi:hypothetical protein
MKKKKLITSFLIIAVLFYYFIGRDLYWHYYWEAATPKQQAYLPKPNPCYQPYGVAIDGQSSAHVTTWNDLNANGTRESNEPPLQKIIVLIAQNEYSYDSNSPPTLQSELDNNILQVTDNQGIANVWDFKPGCVCKCWNGDAVLAWSPPEYKPTTPTKVNLTQDDQTVAFGFHKTK